MSGSVHPSLTPCSTEAVIKGRNPALYEGKGSWQDDRVRFQVLTACGWDDRQKAIELATSYGTKESECWSHSPSVKGKTIRIPCGWSGGAVQTDTSMEMHRAGLRTRKKRGEPLT